VKAAITVVVIAFGCKKTSEVPDPVAVTLREAQPVAPAEPAKPVEPPRPVETFPIAKLAAAGGNQVQASLDGLRAIARDVAPELVVMRINASYVHSDGTLDPTYGTLQLGFALADSADGVVDDPNRPTGAPVPEVKKVEQLRGQCPIVKFEKGAWSSYEISCSKVRQAGARCSINALWDLALREGAPRAAVAVIDIDTRNRAWTFKITDKVRGVEFMRVYPDRCTPPAAPSKPPKKNPYD